MVPSNNKGHKIQKIFMLSRLASFKYCFDRVFDNETI